MPQSWSALQSAAPRPFRDLREVNEAKAARKAEIERRSMLLIPPISPNVLAQMDSFQAALQIPSQLTDQAWEILKPRLVSQREEGEKRERERLEQEAALKAIAEERKMQEIKPKEARDTLEQAWDISQAPIRDRLALYADELIRSTWANGRAVTKDNCAKFAASILMHVHKRFHQDQHFQNVRPLYSGSPHTSGTGTDEKVLIMENMKWVFDNKIKPITEPFSREIFLCNGCEGPLQYHGFEAVIQHYAAKHTNVLSQGNSVVYWRASWPDPPPFHPDPDAARGQIRSAFESSDRERQLEAAVIGLPRPDEAHSYTFNIGVAGTSIAGSSDALCQPFGGVTAYPHQYSQHPPSYNMQPSPQTPGFGAHQHFNDMEVSQTGRGPIVIEQPAQYQPQDATAGLPQPGQSYQTTASNGHSYQSQMADMAKHAREVWFATNSIRGIPAAVRIFVVIYHTATRFAKTYGMDPGVAMFLDGLNHNAQMRPVRSLNGLACKACSSLQRLSGSDACAKAGVDANKLYTLPILLNHFKGVHAQPVNPGLDSDVGPLDWKTDMVELPETSVIVGLVHSAGIDDYKLSLIAQALPGRFPSPLPKLAVLRNGLLSLSNMSVDPYEGRQNNHGILREDLLKTKRGHLELQETQDATMPVLDTNLRPRAISSPKEYEPAGEDEYDPHRPAYLGRLVESKQGKYSNHRPSGPVASLGTEMTEAVADAHRAQYTHGVETERVYPRYLTSQDVATAEHPKPQADAERFLEELQPAIQERAAPASGVARFDSASKTESFHRKDYDPSLFAKYRAEDRPQYGQDGA